MLEGGKSCGDLPSAGPGRRIKRMSAQENKALARRWVEGLFNEGDLDVADEILSPDFVLHVPFDPRELRGPEAVKQFVSTYRHAYPDGHTTIEDQMAQGDMAVNRWRATGTHQGEF
jgi:predicted SnoaL-like aldol condensation-catalyzing enzyme